MRRFVTVLLALLFAGCDAFPTEAMTNEQVVAAVKYCHDNGFAAEQWRRLGSDGATVRVHCVGKTAGGKP